MSHRTKLTHARKQHNHSRLLFYQTYNESLDLRNYPFRHPCSVHREHRDWADDYVVVNRSTGWKTHKYRKQYLQHHRKKVN